mgnify:CR=1 FL=1
MTREEFHENIESRLTEFALNHKSDSRIWSRGKVVSRCSSFSFKLTPYNLLPENGRDFIKKNGSEIIFGLKSGFVFTKKKIWILNWSHKSLEKVDIARIRDFSFISRESQGSVWGGDIKDFFICGEDKISWNKLFEFEYDLIQELQELIVVAVNDYEKILEKKSRDQERLRGQQLNAAQEDILRELDKNGDGKVDVIEGGDFDNLLRKHQAEIIQIDKSYIQQFVQVSFYIKKKKDNIQVVFEEISNTPNQDVLRSYADVLNGEIHAYNLVLFHALTMIASLIEGDLINFYQIHQKFDSLNIFDSQHQKEVSSKLQSINEGIENLIGAVKDMSNTITQALNDLSFVCEETNSILDHHLTAIDSSLKTSNILSLIQVHQLHQGNKNTRSLRE